MKRYLILVCAMLLLASYTFTDAGPPISGGGGGTGDFLADASVPFTGAPVPNAVNTIALGSNAAEWADLFLGDGAIIYGQNDSSATLTSSASKWTANNFGVTTAMTLPATLSSAAAVTWTLMDNQASGLSFGATGAADILKVGTLDAGPTVAVAGELIIGDGQVITFQEATAHPDDSNVVLSGNQGVFSIKTLNGGYTGQDLLIDVGSTSNTVKVTATDTADVLEVNLPTRFTNTFSFDDGAGASPLVYFYDGTDEVAYFQKLDSSYLTLTTVAADGFQILLGNFKVGAGVPGQTLDGADAYVTGLLEVDGMIHADGGVTGPHNGTVGATTPAAGTFTSVDISRQAGDATPLTKAQFFKAFEDVDDGDNYFRIMAPNLTATNDFLWPVGSPSGGQVISWGTPGTGISTGTWVTPALARVEKLATFSFSGGGSDIADNTKVDSYIPAASTITGVIMTASDTSACSSVIDIWSQAYADFPPEAAQKITADAPPTITTALMSKDTTLTGWTKALVADTILRANVTSNDCINTVTVTLIGTVP